MTYNRIYIPQCGEGITIAESGKKVNEMSEEQKLVAEIAARLLVAHVEKEKRQ